MTGEIPGKFANFARCLIYILNSLVLVFMCIDCFINIFFGNLSKQRTVRRVRVMIAVSWVIALISAIPKVTIAWQQNSRTGLLYKCAANIFVSQFFLSYVATLPSYDAFRQCLLERAHAFFSVYPLVESYFAPLIVVLLTYTPVFFRICKKFEKLATSKHLWWLWLTRIHNLLCDLRFSLDPGHAVPARPGDSIDKTQVEGVKITFAFSLVVILCYTPQISLIVWYVNVKAWFCCCETEYVDFKDFCLHFRQYICPNFRPSGDWLVYLIESSKSVFIPAAYFIFRSRDSSGFRGRNQMEFT